MSFTKAAVLFDGFEFQGLESNHTVIHLLEFIPSTPYFLLVIISEMRVGVAIRNDLLTHPAEVLAAFATGHLIAATNLFRGRFAIRAWPVLH